MNDQPYLWTAAFAEDLLDFSQSDFDFLFSLPELSAQEDTQCPKKPEKEKGPVRPLSEAQLKKRGLRSTVMNVLTILFIVFVIGGSVLFVSSPNPDKHIFGYRFYHVLTESMTPTLQEDGTLPPGGFYKGDVIIVKMTKPENVRQGDIITFNPDPYRVTGKEPLTHRCVEIRDNVNGRKGLWFVTKGDLNNTVDPPIPGEAVIGVKVLTVPKCGTVLKTIQKTAHYILRFSAASFIIERTTGKDPERTRFNGCFF
ncbi:MAG: signal peptidase I [Oscillospiraceae bacterium]|nr:signal peptidase I [Oscillospiraceae bacterium]